MSNMQVPASETAASTSGPQRKHIVAAVLGHAMEYYDFIVYSFFAIQIGRTIFAPQSGFSSLMFSLAAFGVGFVARPLGGIIIGMYGDRVGRKRAMVLSFAMMGIATLALACIPSYEAIGNLAPALLVIVRLVQGFAMGGENGVTISYLVESAPRERRGLYCSWQLTSQGIATLVAGSVGLLLSSLLGPEALEDWGWRLAFLLGAIVLPFGLMLRRTLPEPKTGIDLALDSGGISAGDSSPAHLRKAIGLGAFAVASTSMRFYILSFMTTYAIGTLGMDVTAAFAPSALLGAVIIFMSPLNGIIGDRVGRKPVMVGASILFILACYPVFAYISAERTLTSLLIGTAILAVFFPTGNTLAIAEQVPRRVRAGSISLVYGLATVVAGAVSQPGVLWLINVTGDPVAPAYFLIVTSIIGTIAMAMMRETAPCRNPVPASTRGAKPVSDRSSVERAT